MNIISELKYYRFKLVHSNLDPVSKINGNKVIFIHINKTGGTSINKVLNKDKHHLTSKEIISHIGMRRFNLCFKFAVVRNPFERAVSQYLHRVRTNQCGMRDNPISFNDWVNKVFGPEKDYNYYDRQYKMFYTQLRWLKDTNDQMNIDQVLRFENLNDDYEKVSSMIGLKNELPHLNKSRINNSDYKSFYDDDTRKIIEDYFQEDLFFFKYSFD